MMEERLLCSGGGRSLYPFPSYFSGGKYHLDPRDEAILGRALAPGPRNMAEIIRRDLLGCGRRPR